MLTNVTELLTVFLVFRNRLVYETPASDICNLATVFFTLIMFCVSIGLLIIMTGLVPEGPWLILVSLPTALLRLGVDNFRCRHHFFACGATAIVYQLRNQLMGSSITSNVYGSCPVGT